MPFSFTKNQDLLGWLFLTLNQRVDGTFSEEDLRHKSCSLHSSAAGFAIIILLWWNDSSYIFLHSYKYFVTRCLLYAWMHCFVCSKQYFRMPFTRWSLNPLLLLQGVLEDLIVPMHYKPGTGRPAVSLVMDHRNLFSSWGFITVHWTMQLYANRLCVCVCVYRKGFMGRKPVGAMQ